MSTHFVQDGRVRPLAAVTRAYTRRQIGGNRNGLRRWSDGADAMPLGQAREHLPATQGVSLFAPEDRDAVNALELYRMRTKSHLYDEWQVDLAMDLARATAVRTGTLVADCHTCKSSRHVTDDATACPLCHTAYPED